MYYDDNKDFGTINLSYECTGCTEGPPHRHQDSYHQGNLLVRPVYFSSRDGYGTPQYRIEALNTLA
jgi:hypothetical protein